MNVEKKKQVNYLHLLDEPIRVAHESSAIEPVPEEHHVNLDDKLERQNLSKQIRKRKRLIAGLHMEIRVLEGLLNG